jgi:hypothetical protein
MTVGELIEVLTSFNADAKVSICVREPAGWMCPDGAVVDVKKVVDGMDWHNGEVLLVPQVELDIHDVDVWAGNTTPKEKEPQINDLTIPEYINAIERAYKVSKNSKLAFKHNRIKETNMNWNENKTKCMMKSQTQYFLLWHTN